MHNQDRLNKLRIEAKDDNDFVYKVGYALHEFDDIHQNTIVEQNLFLFFTFERRVLNSGIDGFLYMPSGRYAHETERMLVSIGLVEFAEPIRNLAQLMPDRIFVYDNSTRQMHIDEIKHGTAWCDAVKLGNRVYFGADNDMEILSMKMSRYIRNYADGIRHWK